MKYKLYIFFFVALLTATSTSCSSLNTPNLILSNYHVNFGKVKEGTTCSTDIKLYNTGESTLNIRSITTDCSCTRAIINNKNIDPNDSTIIHISLNTKGKKNYNENFVIIQANTDTIIHYVSIISNTITSDSIQ